MNIVNWAFTFYQDLTLKDLSMIPTEQLIRIVQVSCLDIHPKNTRSLDIGSLLEFTFIRDIMIHLSERLEGPSKDIMVLLVNAIKSFIWLE